MMSPYAFYQFWLNVEDEKVGELLRIFTFLSHEEIEALEAQTAEKPFLRAGQRALAEQVTTLVHGAEETARIKAASAALFGGRRPARRSSRPTLAAALAEAGGGDARSARTACPGIVDLLVAAGLAAQQGRGPAHDRRGRRLPQQRAGRPTPTWCRRRPTCSAGEWLVLRRGKKSFAGVRVGVRPVPPRRTPGRRTRRNPADLGRRTVRRLTGVDLTAPDRLA